MTGPTVMGIILERKDHCRQNKEETEIEGTV